MKKAFAVFLLLAVCLVFSCSEKKADSVYIGAVYPLTGTQAYAGIECRDGAVLAIEELNAAGGLLDKKLVLLAEDDEGDAAKTVNAFTKLTAKGKVSFILGSCTSAATQAMSTLAQSDKILQISPTATNINVTKSGDYIFRACFIDPFQGIVGADFVYETLGSRRAAILYDAGADYNTDLADAFKKRYNELGVQVVADETYLSGDADFNAQITRIKAANPDVIYLPNYYFDVAIQSKQIRDQGMTIPIVGADGWDGILESAGDEILNSYWSSGFASDTTDPLGMAFVKTYQTRFIKPASQYSALGYDAMKLVIDGIKAAGSFDPTAVKDAMAKLSGTYVTGNIRFDENRNPIKGAAIMEIVKKDGKLVNQYKTTVNPK